MTVESIDTKDCVDKTFIGYSENMNITMKTEFACERFKTNGHKCGEPVMTIRG